MTLAFGVFLMWYDIHGNGIYRFRAVGFGWAGKRAPEIFQLFSVPQRLAMGADARVGVEHCSEPC